MKFYLSSYKIGNEEQKLKELTAAGNKNLAYINNALDFSEDIERKNKSDEMDIKDLKKLDFSVEIVDLRNYFQKPEALEEKLEHFDIIWVRGGNSFVLAQAFKLSGFNQTIKKYFENNKDIVYGGYSAGICNIGMTLKGLHLVDDPHKQPYFESNEIIWDGLNILNYAIVPHYKSNHGESEDIDKVVEYMINNKIPFKALRDGEVIIID